MPTDTTNELEADKPVESTAEGVNETAQCPECGDETLVTTGATSETYCPECGLVVAEDVIDRGPEWISANADNERRVGGPLTTTRHDRGLSAEIGRNRDGHGKPLSGSTQARFRRLRTWNSRAKFDSKRERNLAHGLGEVKRITSALELSYGPQERAAHLFRRAQAEDLLLGRSIEAMAGASVYAACRLQRLPRFLEEVANIARVEQDRIKTCYKTLNQHFGLAAPPPLPQDYVPRIAGEVDAPPPIQERASRLASSSRVGRITAGKTPAGVAAACLYHASRELGGDVSLTQATISTAANVSNVTLRNIWYEFRDADLPPISEGDT